MVELTAVGGEVRPGIEDAGEHFLDVGDMRADCGLAAERLLEIGRGGQVIGMGVGFQNPVDGQLLLADIGNDGIRRFGGGAARLGVEVQDRIDNRAVVAAWFADDVGDG